MCEARPTCLRAEKRKAHGSRWLSNRFLPEECCTAGEWKAWHHSATLTACTAHRLLCTTVLSTESIYLTRTVAPTHAHWCPLLYPPTPWAPSSYLKGEIKRRKRWEAGAFLLISRHGGRVVSGSSRLFTCWACVEMSKRVIGEAAARTMAERLVDADVLFDGLLGETTHFSTLVSHFRVKLRAAEDLRTVWGPGRSLFHPPWNITRSRLLDHMAIEALISGDVTDAEIFISSHCIYTEKWDPIWHCDIKIALEVIQLSIIFIFQLSVPVPSPFYLPVTL